MSTTDERTLSPAGARRLSPSPKTALALCLALVASGGAGACGDGSGAGNDHQADGGGGNNNNALPCTDGASRCSADLLQTCAGGAWSTVTDCAQGGQICEVDGGTGDAGCVTPGCEAGETRCVGSVLETCAGGAFAPTTDCAQAGEVCRPSTGTGSTPGPGPGPEPTPAVCEPLGWWHVPVTIEDPIMVGESLTVPVDGISFAYDPASDVMVTAFDRDFQDPSVTYLWQAGLTTGVHERVTLSGDVFAQTEGFCVGGEDWCQFLGRDPVSGEWVVVGASASVLMRVGAGFAGVLQPVSGTPPPDSHINRTHRFAWDARRLLLYGSTGPSSFGSTVHALDLDTGAWSAPITGLPQVDDNCLAWDSENGALYTFGGRETQDGGNTTTVLGTFRAIPLDGSAQQTGDLPAGIGPRHAMSCAYDPSRRVIYLYGGAVVNDHWNEELNEYHNDLWAFDPASGAFAPLVADTPSGTLLPPDQYGDRAFEGDPDGPSFGMNRGQMIVDDDHDRLLVVGAVPIFTHEQIYRLDLTGVDQLL